MKNRDYLNQLAAESPDKLADWFDAERESNDECADQGDHIDISAIGRDSREKIEREISAWLGSWVSFSVPLSVVKNAVVGWLDRQAAITRLECMGGFDGFLEARVQERTAELQAQVDELKHERDYWKLHTDLWAEKYKEAERERELYRARVSDLLDAIQEAWRIGQLEYTLVDMDGEVVS